MWAGQFCRNFHNSWSTYSVDWYWNWECSLCFLVSVDMYAKINRVGRFTWVFVSLRGVCVCVCIIFHFSEEYIVIFCEIAMLSFSFLQDTHLVKGCQETRGMGVKLLRDPNTLLRPLLRSECYNQYILDNLDLMMNIAIQFLQFLRVLSYFFR